MTAGFRRLTARGAGVALALVVAGCGKVLEYPDVVAENSAALCSDGVDNDYDDESDCDDSDCDGFCHEENAAECSDGRDNDGDGLADAADPRCWLMTPPKAERCAEASGVETFETFDDWFWTPLAGSIRDAWPWRAWVGAESAFGQGRYEGDGRRDGFAIFSGRRYYADVPGTSLDSLVRQVPFSGSFQGFELSLSASLPPGAVLRAGVVPVELAPSASAPLSGAENALLSVSIDTQSVPPELVLTLSGSPYSKPINGCVGPPCTESMNRLDLVVNEGVPRASFTSADGSLTEVSPPSASLGSVPPSRLVLWGGTSDSAQQVRVDDVVLTVKPEQPCGFFAPQIQGSGCEAGGPAMAFGQSVSVARNAAGEYCALVAASAAEPLRGPTLPAPEAVTAWGSPDGEHWTASAPGAAPFPELPTGTVLIGAGIASDQAGLHAAVAYRDGDQVRLGFVDGESCERWGNLEPASLLFDDAEAPSYVITGNRHDIYFTRPPGAGARTLWRVSRDALELPSEPLAAMPREVEAPVNVTRVGSRDLVLVYARAADASNRGVGLLVGGSDGQIWLPTPEGSLVEPPPRPDLWEGQGRLGFDDRGVISAALAWGANGGFVLYGGVSTSGRIESARYQPVLAVGTARLSKMDEPFTLAATVPDPCGDGACGARETCATCAADCGCDERVLLRDAFVDKPWELVATDLEPTVGRYLTSDPPALNWSGSLDAGEQSWFVLPLEAPVQGDFELSFDWLDRWRPPLSCTIYVGLGDMGSASSEAATPTAGVFVRMKKDETCVDAFFASAVAVSQDDNTDGDTAEVGSCTGEDAIPADRWQRMVLRRRGDNLSVVTERNGACGPREQSIVSRAGTSELSTVLVGFGGRGFEECSATTDRSVWAFWAQGSIENLELKIPGGRP